ncbi:MAG: NADH-quinone oxidoreductase subunit C [Gaiellales bacterium]
MSDEDTDATALALGFEHSRVSEAFGEWTVDVEPADVPRVLEAAIEAGYDFLMDLAASDHLGFGGAVAGYWSAPSGSRTQQDMNREGSAGVGLVPQLLGPKRFAISYQLLAREPVPPRRLRVRTWLDDGEHVPSCVQVFPAADYLEREAFDLMGISFDGHPNLERIFLPEGWDGHPHRKDYPIGGEPVQFSDAV